LVAELMVYNSNYEGMYIYIWKFKKKFFTKYMLIENVFRKL
jgi:hypothetical protein